MVKEYRDYERKPIATSWAAHFQLAAKHLLCALSNI